MDFGLAMDPAFPGLGFNPAPGSPGSVDQLVMQLSASAKHLEAAYQTLTRVGGGGADWSGDAAEGFSRRIAPLPRQLAAARDSFDRAARQLDVWRADLDGLQAKARAYEDEAKEAKARVERAKDNPDLDLAGVLFTDDRELALAEQRLVTARRELDSASEELDHLRRQAGELAAQHEDLSKKCAAAIRAAAENAPDGPGLLDRLGQAVEGVLLAPIKLAEGVAGFVRDHANSIAAVGDVLSTMGTVVGLVGTALDCTGVGAIVGVPLAGVSSALSLGALGFHAVGKAGGADVETGTMISDGVGVLSFGFAKAGHVAAGAGGSAGRLITAVARGEDLHTAVESSFAAKDIMDWFGPNSSLKYFVPQNERQGAQVAAGLAVPVLGPAAMAVPFENAWNAGAEKDRQAAAARAAGH